LILGIGSGWFAKDYQAYGYDFTTAGARLDLLADYLPRIEARFAALNPPPTRDIPVLIGGGGERKTLKLVARHAHIWHGFGDLETMTRKSSILAEHCASVGRDPGEIERSTALNPSTSTADADALRAAGFSLFTVSVDGPDYDLAPVRDRLRWRDAVNG